MADKSSQMFFVWDFCHSIWRGQVITEGERHLLQEAEETFRPDAESVSSCDSFHKNSCPLTTYTKCESHEAHPTSGITCMPTGGSGNHAPECCFTKDSNQRCCHIPLERGNWEYGLLLGKRGGPSAVRCSMLVWPFLLSSNRRTSFRKSRGENLSA